MEGLQETWVVARAEAARTFRSARVIVLFALYALFMVIVLFVTAAVTDALSSSLQAQLQDAPDQEQAKAALEGARSGFLGWVLDADPALLEALRDVPLLVIVVFKISLFWLPPYLVLMAFDQISAEVGQRSIRYLTVRARRWSILLGKFLAQAAVLLALVFTIDLAIFLYAKLTNDTFSWGLMMVTLLKFWSASLVFALAYLALTMLCSALFRQGALSLIFNFFALFVFWLINAIGSIGVTRELLPSGMPGPERITSQVAYLRYVTPSHYSTGLLHPDLKVFAVSAGAYVGFAVVFMLLAWAIFRARDV